MTALAMNILLCWIFGILFSYEGILGRVVLLVVSIVASRSEIEWNVAKRNSYFFSTIERFLKENT